MSVHSKQKGVGLVEVVISAAIIALVAVSLIAAYFLHLRAGLELPARVQAVLLAEEGVEAVKFLRSQSWNENIAPLSLNTTYYLATSSTWVTTTTPSAVLGKFGRVLTVYPVNRDVSGNIVESGGTLDGGSRKITMTVSWRSANGATTTYAVTTYLANLFNN